MEIISPFACSILHHFEICHSMLINSYSLFFDIFTGANIAEQLDAASIVPPLASPPPSSASAQSPVTTIPSSHPELFNPGMVSPVNIPGPSVACPMQPVPVVHDRKFVAGPSTSLPGGVVPKTERFDT